MRAEIEHQDPAAGRGDAHRFGDGPLGMVRVMQRLRQHRHVDFAVCDRQPFELAALPGHVADAAALRQTARAPQHDARIDPRR